MDRDPGRAARGGARDKFDPGPIDLSDLPPLLVEQAKHAPAQAESSKSPPDLKPDRSDVLPPLPERSLGLDL